MDTKGLQKEFINWCKSKNKSPKSEDETKQLFVAFMKEKHPEEYKQAVQNQQKQQQAQAKKAAHGAKLNYFKFLKNQCAEDEEIVYYKKGGSVGCGCKKKEQGGEVKKDCGGSVVAKFKASRKMQSGGAAKKVEKRKEPYKTTVPDKNGEYKDNRGNIIVTKKGIAEREKELKANKNEEGQADPKKVTKPVTKKACGSKIKKHQEGSVITQFKMHRQGGSLNKAFL